MRRTAIWLSVISAFTFTCACSSGGVSPPEPTRRLETIRVILPPDIEHRRADFQRTFAPIGSIINDADGYAAPILEIEIAPGGLFSPGGTGLPDDGSRCATQRRYYRGIDGREVWYASTYLRAAQNRLGTCHGRGRMARTAFAVGLDWEISHLWAGRNGMSDHDQPLSDPRAIEIARRIAGLEWVGDDIIVPPIPEVSQ